MASFLEQLNALNPPDDGRRWVYVPYDQLNPRIGPLDELEPHEAAILLVETTWKGQRRPYHKQKLAWVLASQRQFALEQAARGVHVRVLFGEQSYGELLRAFLEERGLTAKVARPAERELRVDLQPLVDDRLLDLEPHRGWFSTEADFDVLGERPWRMDAFYRQVRQRSDVLMADGSPIGGRYSLDGDNREPWRGEPAAPQPPTFAVGEIEEEVAALVAERFADHPGDLDMSRVASTAEAAHEHWQWFLSHGIENFGEFEDAMSTRSATIFHSLVSPLLNNGRLIAADLVDDVEQCDAPLNSREGFIRQVIGWREFVRHVHERTDGFRDLPGIDVAPAPVTGGLDGGASPNFLDAQHKLPPAYWGEPSGLNCLDTVVSEVWRTGYGHHITRLMVASNIATLLGYSPRELTDWFWVAYIDAYDWVVEPNVLAMGTFATGDVMTTKPYVSGSNYIHKMSDYCSDCVFDPRKTCPLRRAYWAFLAENEERLADNQRVRRALWALGRRSEHERRRDRQETDALRASLAAGERADVSGSA